MRSLSSITRGASLYFVGKIVLNALGFLLQLILTRGLGAGLYGVYAYGKTVLMILLMFTNLGSDQSLLKYLPEYNDDTRRQRLILALAMITSLLGAVVSAVALFVFAPTVNDLTLNDPHFVDVLRLFAIILVLDTVAKVVHSTFRSLEQLEYEVFSNKLARPTLRLCAAAIALVFGFSLHGVMVALVVANFIALGVALYFFLSRFDLRPSLTPRRSARDEIVEYYNFSIPLTLKDAGNVLIKRVDIMMVGFFLPSTAVGIYNVSVLLAGILVLPVTAFNQLFPPIASRLYSNGETDELSSLHKTVTRWVFTISFIAAIGAVVYRRELLALFGVEFVAGSTVLALFVGGQLINCASGSNGYLLMMTDHQYILLVNQWLFGALNLVLNYVLILKYGLVGAAVATAGILVVLNVVKTIELWYLEGLFPYSTRFVKPISAGIAALIVMHLTQSALSGIGLLVGGGFLGGLTYVAVLLALGIESDDKQFFRTIADEKL